jgi:transcriptional regulator with XRE-family HTH domain
VTAAARSPIAICRFARGWSQAELAARAGCRRETIGRIERGYNSPQLLTARALAQAFDVELEVLFPDREHAGRGA